MKSLSRPTPRVIGLAEEILEAWIYLDDFCHFLLHAIDLDQQNRAKRDKSMDYAGRMFYMIQRRTIRDLIIRAQSNYTAARRKTAYNEILQNDKDAEKHFKDIYRLWERFSTAICSVGNALIELQTFESV